MINLINRSEILKRIMNGLLLSLIIIGTNVCSSTKGVKKENSDDEWKKKYEETKDEYNLLLRDYNYLTNLESDCYALNKKFSEQSQNSIDLLNDINKNNEKRYNKKEMAAIAIVTAIISIFVTGAIVGASMKAAKRK